MSEYTKDELMLLNGIIKIDIDEGRLQKTDGIIALQNKLKEDLREKIKNARITGCKIGNSGFDQQACIFCEHKEPSSCAAFRAKCGAMLMYAGDKK